MFNRSHRILAVAVLLTAFVTPLAAEDEAFDFNFRINLELAGAEATDVFKSFAALVNAEADLDPELAGEVTIQLNNVSTRTTLNAVCEMLSCEWWMEDGSPRRLVVRAQGTADSGATEAAGSLDTTVSLSLVDAPAEEVLKSFASIGRWTLVQEKTTVSVELADTPIREALDQVCSQVGCSWSLDEAEGVLRIDWMD